MARIKPAPAAKLNVEVMGMPYENLEALIDKSQSSRRYFLSLPIRMQMELHAQSDWIHSAAQLHKHSRALQDYQQFQGRPAGESAPHL